MPVTPLREGRVALAQRALSLLLGGHDAYRRGSGERVHRWAYDVVASLGGEARVIASLVRLGELVEEERAKSADPGARGGLI